MAEFAMAGGQLLSGGLAAAGSIASGNAAFASAAETARIMSENAQRLEQSAKLAEAQGVTAAARARKQGRRLRGDSLAALSVSGVDITEGSPLEILSAQAGESEFQALQQKFEHDQRAWQMRTQAYDISQRASMTIRQGYQQRDAAMSQAFAQIVGGAVKAGSPFLNPGKTTTDTSPYGGRYADRPD